MANEIRVQITAETAAFFSQLSQAAGKVQEWAKSAQAAGKAATDGFNQAKNASDGFTGSVVKGGLIVQGLRSALGGLREVLGQVAETYMKMDAAQRTLQFATGDGAASLAFVKRSSQELGLELISTAKAYGQLAASSKGTALEGEPTRKIFTAVASASAVMGLSADDTAGAIKALGQMMSKGKVQAEELRGQLGERIPGAFQMAAKAMGVTTQELDKMLVDGKVYAEDFLPKFAKALLENLGDAPKTAAQSIQAQVNKMKNAWTELLLTLGNSGVMGEAAGAMQSLSAAMALPEGRQAVSDFGVKLSELMSILKAMGGFTREHLGLIVGMGAAYGAVRIAQTVAGWAQAIRGWVTAQTASISANHMAIVQGVALAENEVRNTAATLARAQAEVVKYQAMAVSTTATISAAEAAAIQRVQELAVTQATEAHALAQMNLARAQTSAGLAARGSAAIYAALGGPVGILVLALTGLVVLLNKVIISKAEMAANAKKYQDAENEEIRAWGDQIRMIRDLDSEMKKGKLSKEEYALASKRIEVIQKDLVGKYPELLRFMKDEAGNARTLAEATRLLNDEKVRSAELAMKEAEAAQKNLQKLVEDRKQWIEADTAKVPDGSGYATVDANRDAVIRRAYNTKSLKVDLEILERQKRIVQETRQSYESLATIQASILASERKSTVGTTAKTKENVYAEELLRIRERTLKYEESATLAQKERVDLKRVELDLEKELERIRDLKKAGKLTPNQADNLSADAEQNAATARLNIQQKYAAERVRIDHETQNKLELLEEEGYARKAASMRQAYEKANEERRRAGLADMNSAGTEANIESMKLREIDREAAKLKAGLSQLAEQKGRALTFTEQVASLDDLAKKMGLELPEAIQKARGEIEQLQQNSQSGWAGMLAGLQEFLTQSQNKFQMWKDATKSILTGATQSFASFFESVFERGMTGAQKWDLLWKGLAKTVVNALAQMAAQWLVTAIARNVFKKAEQSAAASEAVALQAQAGAGIFAAHSYIPFVGPAIAAGLVAMMNATLIGNIASAKGMTAFASGGLIDHPTLGILGEGFQRELVVPEVTFTNWANNLARNITRQQSEARGYQLQGAGYAQAAAVHRAESAGAPVSYQDYRGALIVTTSSREWSEAVQRGVDGFAWRKG